jgi:transcription elongation GreA/GreB family factor
MTVENLRELLEAGRFDALESEWLSVIEQGQADVAELLGVIKATLEAHQQACAELLAWTWLSEYRNRTDPQNAFDLAAELLTLLPDSDQLREDAAQLYREAWPDRADAVLAASGLEAGQRADRALRVLRSTAQLKPGAFVVERTDSLAYEVVSLDHRNGIVELRRPDRQIQAAVRDLAFHYEPVEPNDFRVLEQLKREQLVDMIDAQPADLVLGLLKSRGGKITSDDLHRALCPRYVQQSDWPKWWTRARAALRNCGQVHFEGRSPLQLVFDPSGQTARDRLEDQMAKTTDPLQRWQLLRTYLAREPADPEPIVVGAGSLARQADDAGGPDASTGVLAAVILEWLRERAPSSAGKMPPSRLGKLLQNCSDPGRAMAAVGDVQLWQAALAAIRRDLPSGWEQIYLVAMATAPPTACNMIAAALLEAGRAAELHAAVEQALQQPDRHSGTLAWLWHGPQVPLPLALPGRIEVLLRIVAALDELAAPPPEDRELAQTARTKLRSAIAAKRHQLLRDCLTASIEPAMAVALRRQVERCRGLTPAARQDVLQVIRDVFPQLWAEPSRQPWADPNVLYVTAAGLKRKQAELDDIIEVKMRQNARAIGEAAARGDLSENSEYRFALEERDLLRARVAQIQSQMVMARLVTAQDVRTDEVGIGTRVTLTRLTDAQQISITILGPWEADVERSIYNYQAPTCQKVLGLKRGDTAMLPIANEPSEYRVEDISVGVP